MIRQIVFIGSLLSPPFFGFAVGAALGHHLSDAPLLCRASAQVAIATLLVATLVYGFSHLMRARLIVIKRILLPGVYLAIAAIAAIGVANALIIAFSLYALCLWIAGPAPVLALVAIFYSLSMTHPIDVAITLSRFAWYSFDAKRLDIVGKLITRDEAPRLWELVSDIADKIGTPPPENIIIGFHSNVSAMEGGFIFDGRRIRGQALIIGIALFRMLSEREMSAVIGHELGHFKRGDTQRVRALLPAMKIINGTVVELSLLRPGRIVGAPTLPSRKLSEHLHGMLAGADASYSREAELAADRIGARATSPLALACALFKTYDFYGQWTRFMRKIDDNDPHRLGAESGNASKAFFDAWSSAMRSATPIVDDKRDFLPGSTHPPLSRRLASLGVCPQSALLAARHAPTRFWANDYIPDYERHERELTRRYRNRMGAISLKEPRTAKTRRSGYRNEVEQRIETPLE